MAAKQKQKRIKAVQQKLQVFRSHEPLQSLIQWGINHSVSELRHVQSKVMLMPDDFKAFSKIQVRNHLFNKDSKPGYFSFKEYSPLVFKNLRERFGVDDDDYLASVSKEQLHEVESSGRSGSRFLTTNDGRFVIKTIPPDEADELQRILRHYHMYIVEQHGETLLPQFLGMYKATTNDFEAHFFISTNIFNPAFPIHLKYDLKGSTVDRQASDKEKAKALPTFKDVDFMRDNCHIRLSIHDRTRLLKMLQMDTDFLTQLHLMDYSLLVGFHNITPSDGSPSLNNPVFDADPIEEADESVDVLTKIAEGVHLTDGVEMGRHKYKWRGRAPVSFDLEHPAAFNIDFNQQDEHKTRRYSLQHKTSEALECKRRSTSQEELGPFAFKAAPEEGGVLYFMALLDILTHYGMRKRTAHTAKTVKHGPGAEISTVKPIQYAKRFMDFVSKIVISHG